MVQDLFKRFSFYLIDVDCVDVGKGVLDELTHPVDYGVVATPLEHSQEGIKEHFKAFSRSQILYLFFSLSFSLCSMNEWFDQERRTGFFGERRTIQRLTSLLIFRPPTPASNLALLYNSQLATCN